MKKQTYYNVYYIIKSNGTEELHLMEGILAGNAREACKLCKVVVKEQSGRNAFRTTTRMDEETIRCCYGGVVYPTLPSRKV